jgi:hypothetical protein
VLPTVIAILGALFGGGGVFAAFVTNRKNRYDAEGKARDELWRELATVRTEVARLQGRVDELVRRELDLLKKNNELEVRLASELLATKDALEDKDKALADAKLWQERYEKLEVTTGRFSSVQQVPTKEDKK